ncbi:MAG: hypothetical protein JKX76_01900 [Colwellia sp.]|nr:hypothetical protein [Colwellia sp.]
MDQASSALDNVSLSIDSATGSKGGWSPTKIIVLLIALGVVGYLMYKIFGGFLGPLSEIFGDAASLLGSVEKDMESCLSGSWVCITLLFAVLLWPFAKLASYVYKNPSDLGKDTEFETGESLSDLSKKVEKILDEKKSEMDEQADEYDTKAEGDLLVQQVALDATSDLYNDAINSDPNLTQADKNTKISEEGEVADAQASAKADDLGVDSAEAGDVGDDAADIVDRAG